MCPECLTRVLEIVDLATRTKGRFSFGSKFQAFLRRGANVSRVAAALSENVKFHDNPSPGN